jgi:hypothetical protein
LGQGCLGFLGQQQTAEAALRVCQGGGDGVMAVKPDRALGGVGAWPGSFVVARALVVGTLMKRF